MGRKKYLSETWSCGGIVDDVEDYEIIKPLEKVKSERKIDSIIDSYQLGMLKCYFDPKGIEDIKEKRRAIEEEYKQKLKDLLLYMEAKYPSKAIEGRKKLESLIPIYGKKIIGHMILHSELSYMDFDKVVECLPSKEILEKDLKQYELLKLYACGYNSKIDYPLSLKLVMDLVEGKSLEKYPEQLIYVHQACMGDGLKTYETLATFTKQEFIDSIQKEKVKKLEKK